jgi:crotonobetainyl-CoA:carnitine CoA-transferase CaiB-like acyl-CoA transferase
MADGILDGVRIVDLSFGIAGPVATHLLAEVGAEVVKVEPPGGDPTRASAGFATWNRSKKGVVLDLHDEEDRARLDRLLADADVLVHGFRPSEARARGLDDAALAERFPDLIVSAVTGYPGNHPDAERAGWDVLVQARSGAMWEVDGARPGPIFLRFPLPSWSTVYLTATGILARLVVRGRTGRAGPAHTSLYQGMLAVLAMLWHRGDTLTEMMKRKMPLPKGFSAPALSMFECADGEWLQTLPGYIEHPLVIETTLEMGAGLVEVDGPIPTPEQLEILQGAFTRRTRDEWLAALHAGDVAAAPMSPIGSVFTNTQAVLNDYVVDVDDRAWGRARQTLAPYQIEPKPAVRSPAPRLGEHSDEVFAGEPERAQRPDRPAGGRPYPARGLLDGVKVVDFGMFLAGPLGPMLLADLGADVIKVEALTGDRMRVPEQVTLFVGCQRGKRSVALDLTNPDSRPVLERLVRWADVVHHNLRMPAARRLGLDYESLAQIKPDLVYCHVSSYGSVGPEADWPGYDPVGQALSGWPIESAPPGTKPMWYRFGMMDHQCAMSSVIPTLLALYRRDRTGEGSCVAGSLLGAATESNSETMLLLETGQTAPYPHLDAHQTGLHPGYRIYPTADDRWVAVAAVGAQVMAALRRVAGVAESDGDTTYDALAAAFAGRTADELLGALDAAGVPAELVREDWEDGFFEAEIGRPARLAVSYPHPEYGRFEQPGAFWDLGDLDLTLDHAPPLLGQHTAEVLHELGFEPGAIAKMADAGVIGGPDVTRKTQP